MLAITQRHKWSSIVFRTLLFAFVWWLLTDGESTSWWVGMPAVLLAMIASIALIPPATLVWSGFFKFVGYFFCALLLVAPM